MGLRQLKSRVGSIYYGWVIVFVAGLGVFFSGPGQTYSNSTFIDEYIQDFGWSRSEVSSLYSTATLIAGFGMMLVGRFIDRLGQRFMMVMVGSMLALACFFNSFVSSIWMLGVGFFIIRLFGQGSMTLVPKTLVAQWFIQKRGIALSLMTLGSFISASLFPIINTWLIHTWSWQLAWRFWGALILIIFVPIAFFTVKNRPEDMGLVPDGNMHKEKSQPKLGTVVEAAEEDWTLKEARKTRAFWAILICVGIPAMVNTGITFHIISIFDENNLSPTTAALVLSLMALVGIPMSFVSGYITEKIKTNYVLMFIFVLEIVLLLLLLVTKNFAMAILFGIIWGIANGFERIGLNIIWPNYFGRKYIGSITGVGSTVMVLGSAFGPLPFGVGFDMFHSYTSIILLTIVFPVIGLISAWIAKKPKKEDVLG
ncbi:MFS transporter [Virgibacillus ndiopensis]|uniref:MFS transporter n=1 Tax=Virgibacillus ndiopensis TaxID=2004408 RepID=UPI000C087414|nr:MFS transporter [Virgibacillus ndiopensis]